MEQAYFFPGQQVDADDLNEITDTLGNQIKNRTIDFFSKGVVAEANDVFVYEDVNNTIQVQPFIAYTVTGERIDVYKPIRALALDLTDPKHRLTNQGELPDEDFGWVQGEEYDIYVAYITKVARPRAHKNTGEFYPTRIVSGFEFYAIRPGIDQIQNTDNDPTPLVRLCHLVYDGTNLQLTSYGYMDLATVKASKVYSDPLGITPNTYNPSTTAVSMEDHIMCMGSGTPTPNNPHGLTPADIGVEDKDVDQHEAEMHSPGLLANRDSVSSAFYIVLNAIRNNPQVPDTLMAYNLQGTERLHHNGTWIDSWDYPVSLMYMVFSDGVGPEYVTLPYGTYHIGLDVSTRKLVVGCDEAFGREIRLTSDAAGMSLVDTIQIIKYGNPSQPEEGTYVAGGYYNLATFTFSPSKVDTNIIGPDSTSNFIDKWDDRVFGSLAPSELQTTKQVIESQWRNVFTLPYELQVKSLKLIDGPRITGETLLPAGYIRGFQVIQRSNNSIIVYPGYCRDINSEMDINLENPITKYVDKPWEQGGYNTVVGGLQNTNTRQSALTPAMYGGPLHIFVIRNAAGLVDVAFDTDIKGTHINESSDVLTYSFIYKRRVATIYLSHHADDESAATRQLIRPFTSYQDGNGLFIQYITPPVLDEACYTPSTNTFSYTYVPSGYPFKGKFTYAMNINNISIKVKDIVEDSGEEQTYTTYNLHQSDSASIYLPECTNTLFTLAGAGEFETYMLDGTIKTNGSWDFLNSLTCIGYYDSRDIL